MSNLIGPMQLSMMQANYIQNCMMAGLIKNQQQMNECVAYFQKKCTELGWIPPTYTQQELDDLLQKNHEEE
jgi:hypothetical protein